METIYDVIILGAGPAGLAAGLYAGRSRLNTLIIEKGQDGGQIAITDEIDNYPGALLEGESGPSLVARMRAQCEKFGAKRLGDTVKAVHLTGDIKTITCAKGEYRAKSVILATGAFPKPIGCPGEAQFMGGDAAVEEAMYLTKFARKVTIIHRRDQLRAAKSIQEKAFANPKIHFLWDTVVEELAGDEILERMRLRNVKTGAITEIVPDEEDGLFGVFVFIGFSPNSALFEGQVELEHGYIKTDEAMHTNLPGVFAAGDIRVKTLRQVVTAAADGAIAAMEAEHYLSNL